jgi:hypothetical protein
MHLNTVWRNRETNDLCVIAIYDDHVEVIVLKDETRFFASKCSITENFIPAQGYGDYTEIKKLWKDRVHYCKNHDNLLVFADENNLVQGCICNPNPTPRVRNHTFWRNIATGNKTAVGMISILDKTHEVIITYTANESRYPRSMPEWQFLREFCPQ